MRPLIAFPLHTGPRHETWLAHPPRSAMPAALLPWLSDPGSLTARIRARCSRFAVQVVCQKLARVHRDEALLLGLRPGERAWVREVLLVADGRPVVFARSLLPPRNVRGAWNLFHGMGSRPLGQALFSDPAISRLPLACRRLDGRDARYHRAQAALNRYAPAQYLPRTLWARRSVFLLRGSALMVSEAFLPEILELPR
ncbi:chorismate--pyruvate lyase family protein [Thauera sp.]|jgi:chorismate--pyruvate lyase|uniref:chorismate--pyruvate lyase family protein n=1 Tax=Thauera sp. TaxID=1905334 RepID=UPI002A3602EE|nr:chorismate lyase [Thauera sp.]MDX9884231.1 chorismate lyase [Thauera sp.]